MQATDAEFSQDTGVWRPRNGSGTPATSRYLEGKKTEPGVARRFRERAKLILLFRAGNYISPCLLLFCFRSRSVLSCGRQGRTQGAAYSRLASARPRTCRDLDSGRAAPRWPLEAHLLLRLLRKRCGLDFLPRALLQLEAHLLLRLLRKICLTRAIIRQYRLEALLTSRPTPSIPPQGRLRTFSTLSARISTSVCRLGL